ncbi:MAG: hypothetical protein JKP92_01375 [Alphaproteobacteria bacterium]|nr:hypothetical protein [Alphaproteobacteria bacterium]
MEMPLTTKGKIEEYAARYDAANTAHAQDELDLMARMRAAGRRGHMDKSDLIALAAWKWRGGAVRRLCEHNTQDEVREISATAFSARSERLRIGALMALSGVAWPMASAALHLAELPGGGYPILDVWAMQAVEGSTAYTLGRWLTYTKMCRDTARDCGVDMRTLDKALWAFGKFGIA